MALSDDLLINALNEVHASVDSLRGDEKETREQLHAAILENTSRVSELNTRMAGMETNMHHFRQETRKEARRWGAVGGVFTAVLAILAELLRNLLWPHVQR
jgi:outer membrane murein-binding lipoprotein Lpp